MPVKGGDGKCYDDDCFPTQAFFHACKNGDLEIVQALLKENFLIDTQHDGKFLTPLVIAIDRGHADLCELLLQCGANTRADAGGEQLIFFAVKKQNTSIIKLLIKHDKQIVDIRDDQGARPLFYGVAIESEKIVKLLIDNDADINAQAEWDQTALHAAVQVGSLPLAKLLVREGIAISNPDASGETPKMQAHYSDSDRSEIYEFLRKLEKPR